jgi:hypothetical protein
MKRIVGASAALLLGYAIFIPAGAQQWTTRTNPSVLPSAGLPSGVRSTLNADADDIAGVRLGMTPKEVRTILVKSGFTVPSTDPPQDSWEAKLTAKLAFMGKGTASKSTVPMFTMGKGADGRRIEVWYNATPQGALAGSVKYQISPDRLAAELFRSRVITKYGTPAKDSGRNTMIWCSTGETNCVTLGNKEQSHLEASVDYKSHTIFLVEGRLASAVARAEFDAAIVERAPGNAISSF